MRYSGVFGFGALALLCVTGNVTASANDAITVASYGGQLTKSQIKAFYEPFAQTTGIRVNSVDYPGGLAEVKAQVMASNVTWDVVDLELADAIRGCDEGLFERIDRTKLPSAPDGTPAADDFLHGTLQDCGVPMVVWSTIFAYDNDRIGQQKPETAADFFDVKRWPGKRAMRKAPRPTLEFALMADGVPPDQVYEVLSTSEGVDRAFAKLDTIKKDVIWWESGAQPPQLLADGEVVMTTAYNGRIFGAALNENKPFVIVWHSQIWDVNLFAIPKGSPNAAAAQQFIAFATDTQRLADQAKWISYGPARASSIPLIGKDADGKVDMLPNLPTAPANMAHSLQINSVWWGDYGDQLNERFNTWLSQN